MTPWQQHQKKWLGCTRCPLHEGRCKVVLCRGPLPCDVLFVGEAPGASEDVLGTPFEGPAGHLLDSIIDEALMPRRLDVPIRVAFTNLVGCIPKRDGEKFEPEPSHIKACAPRLRELLAMAKPKLVVAVGTLSAKWVDWQVKIEIVHPAAILRANVAQRGLMIQRCVVRLANAVESL